MHVFVCDTHKLKQNFSPPPRKVIRKPDTGMLAGLLMQGGLSPVASAEEHIKLYIFICMFSYVTHTS